jgi:prepilin-type N-terminal cleavage/methylation domain-containing protein
MSSKAFTLIEILIAITVMTLGVVGFHAAITRVASLTFSNSDRFIASRLAQEGIELVSNIRDTNWVEKTSPNWDDGLANNGYRVQYNKEELLADSDTPLKIDSKGFYNYDNGDDSKFKRKITITHINADKLKVKVRITWSGKGSPLEVEEHLYNWK